MAREIFWLSQYLLNTRWSTWQEEIANHNPLLLRILSYEQNSPLRTWRTLSATRAAQTNAAVSGPGSNAPSPGSGSPTDASAYRFMCALTHRIILPLNCSALNPIAIEISLTHRLRMLVGISRVYLGVHPSDVLAGWAAGSLWSISCTELARWLQHQGAVEPSGSVALTVADRLYPMQAGAAVARSR